MHQRVWMSSFCCGNSLWASSSAVLRELQLTGGLSSNSPTGSLPSSLHPADISLLCCSRFCYFMTSVALAWADCRLSESSGCTRGQKTSGRRKWYQGPPQAALWSWDRLSSSRPSEAHLNSSARCCPCLCLATCDSAPVFGCHCSKMEASLSHSRCCGGATVHSATNYLIAFWPCDPQTLAATRIMQRGPACACERACACECACADWRQCPLTLSHT